MVNEIVVRESQPIELNDLLRKNAIDPEKVLVLRHRPPEPELNKVLPWLAAEKPDMFNAYQQTQTEKVEKAMTGSDYVASFIGHQPGKAVFIALYEIRGSKSLTFEEFWKVPAYVEMKKKFGMKGLTEKSGRASILWFDLVVTEICASWKGKLVMGWPPPEISWWRRAHKNTFPIFAILDESILVPRLEWNRIVFTWDELSVLPMRWQSALSQWRGIYYIFDASDRKGYVGSAYGDDNLLGRWQSYAASGHGGNALLRNRAPENFRFSILQTLPPDMEANDVIQLESSWKLRLHTHSPDGLNEN
ncbi:MAG TPA: GIY-YIG nuclease family protein [Candidatus Sulfotelmatobacter sp.]|nr:GIY-YIG nuclease family protein [Candidatus Sulfotelmatobacter sp.]